MRKPATIAPIALSLLAGLLVGVTPARADDEEKLPPMTVKELSNRLTNVVRTVSSSYYYEIDSADLLRWAVKGLYERRAERIPEDILQRLEKACNPNTKELRDILAAVAADCRGDLRRSAEVACERMLGRLDGRTQIFGGDRGFLLGTVLYVPEGIGVQLAVDPKTGMLRIANPWRGGPAYAVGRRSGDLITEMVRPSAGSRMSRRPPSKSFQPRA